MREQLGTREEKPFVGLPADDVAATPTEEKRFLAVALHLLPPLSSLESPPPSQAALPPTTDTNALNSFTLCEAATEGKKTHLMLVFGHRVTRSRPTARIRIRSVTSL